MAISNLNGVLAGMQPMQFILKSATPTPIVGRPLSLWSLGGVPGPGSFNAGLNGAIYSSSLGLVPGQIPHTDPATGLNSYLARFQCSPFATFGTVMLCDRLWDNTLAVTSGTQTISAFPTLPARDATGTTNGAGVVLAVEVSAATGSGSPIITVSYTDSSGTAGNTGTNIDATGASVVAGSFFRISLQAGDIGVRSVQSVNLSATWTSGTINLVAYRVLALLETTAGISPTAVDAVTSGFPQLFNGVVPFIVVVPGNTLPGATAACYVESQG